MGSDHTAPVVDLILPRTHHNIYNQTALEVHVQDDGEIDRVEFLVDGEEYDGQNLQLLSFPFQTIWDCRSLGAGQHMIQALVFDKSGRIGYSPRVIFYKMPPDSLQPNDSLSYFDSPKFDGNGDMSVDGLLWRIPSETGQYTGFGTRFTLDRPGRLIKYGINLQFRDNLRDNNDRWWGTQLKIEVLSTKDGLPFEVLSSGEFDILTLGTLSPSGWIPLNVPIGSRRKGSMEVPSEFIITVELSETATGDTLSIASDLGSQRNWHGLVRENGEWRSFDAGPRVAFNPLIWAKIRYPELVD